MEKVCVLMSTYNGEEYLREQIESILKQDEVEVKLVIRDDGSSDKTLKIIEEYKKNADIVCYKGENVGAAQSFMNLINEAPKSEYYALSDQDDVWQSEKLITAVKYLKKYNNVPALYVSNTILTDENLNIIDKNKKINTKFTFGNILIKNNANGCTMVFNQKLMDIINEIGCVDVGKKIWHDHYIYMLCLAIGGKVICDEYSYIYYRQHGSNLVGGRRNLIKKIRGNGILSNKCTRSTWANVLYKNCKDYITEDNKRLLLLVINYKRSIKDRLGLAFNKDIKPNSEIEKILIFMNVILGKF